jgi:hypothetical protein
MLVSDLCQLSEGTSNDRCCGLVETKALSPRSHWCTIVPAWKSDKQQWPVALFRRSQTLPLVEIVNLRNGPGMTAWSRRLALPAARLPGLYLTCLPAPDRAAFLLFDWQAGNWQGYRPRLSATDQTADPMVSNAPITGSRSEA